MARLVRNVGGRVDLDRARQRVGAERIVDRLDGAVDADTGRTGDVDERRRLVAGTGEHPDGIATALGLRRVGAGVVDEEARRAVFGEGRELVDERIGHALTVRQPVPVVVDAGADLDERRHRARVLAVDRDQAEAVVEQRCVVARHLERRGRRVGEDAEAVRADVGVPRVPGVQQTGRGPTGVTVGLDAHDLDTVDGQRAVGAGAARRDVVRGHVVVAGPLDERGDELAVAFGYLQRARTRRAQSEAEVANRLAPRLGPIDRDRSVG